MDFCWTITWKLFGIDALLVYAIVGVLSALVSTFPFLRELYHSVAESVASALSLFAAFLLILALPLLYRSAVDLFWARVIEYPDWILSLVTFTWFLARNFLIVMIIFGGISFVCSARRELGIVLGLVLPIISLWAFFNQPDCMARTENSLLYSEAAERA